MELCPTLSRFDNLISPLAPSHRERRKLCREPWLILLLVVLVPACTESVPVEVPRTADQPKSPRVSGSTSVGGETLPVDIVINSTGFSIKTADGTLRGARVTPGQRPSSELYRRSIKQVIEFYPKSLLEKIKLRKILVCEGLTFDETACFAFTDVVNGCIYLNVNSGLEARYLERTVHHELFHQLDFVGDHQLDPDPKWESLNSVDFHYRGDVERLQADPAESARDDGLRGFLNRYSTASPTEDKAEVYTALILEPEKLRNRMDADVILRRKVGRIREMLDAFGPYAKVLTGY